jgi:hypothetical protein
MVEKSFKSVSLGFGERLVRVLEKNENGTGFSLSSFSISAVERVKEIDEKKSFLILVSGFKIPVALSFTELEQKIYRPDFKTDDSGILDLTKVTGKTAQLFEAEGLKPGAVADDGSIYLGFHNEKDWFVTGKEDSLRMNFNEAVIYAKNLRAHGHDDWIVPPGNDPQQPDILKVMFNNRSLGAFRETYSTSWHWSSTEDSDSAQQCHFNDGNRINYSKRDSVYVRCVRAVPRF